jgi:uncharacterized protein YndB with AHSA1/START domain
MGDAKNFKTVDVTVEIDAPPDAVWRALTVGEEVGRWFSLNAEVEPGVGGVYKIDWGPDVAGQGTITAWEEGSRLAYDEEWPGVDLDVPVAVEYTIESSGGKTVVRMVNSGFSADADWADYLDTLDSGWRYFLWNLQVYLERHAGTPRRMVWDRRKIAVDKATAWERLLGPGGLAVASTPLAAGDPVVMWSGHQGHAGRISEPIHITAQIPALNDALLFIELEPGEGEHSLGVWLSLYGVDVARADAVETALKTALGSLFEEVAS